MKKLIVMILFVILIFGALSMFTFATFTNETEKATSGVTDMEENSKEAEETIEGVFADH